MTKEARILRELTGIHKAMNAIIKRQMVIARCLQAPRCRPAQDEGDPGNWAPSEVKKYMLDASKRHAKQRRSGR
jgi:hypothetical protein